MVPVEFKVKVRMDKIEEYSGKIFMPPSTQAKQQIEQDLGTIIAMGGRACKDFGDPTPKVGSRVMVSRHSGYLIYEGTGRDKVLYKIINDKDITMMEEEEGDG